MLNTLLFDFSRVLLFPIDEGYTGELNPLHLKLSKKQNYQLLDHFRLNGELLGYLEKLKSDFDLYIFTAGTVQDAPEVRAKIDPIFQRIFSAGEMGVSKKDSEAYLRIAEEIGKDPSEILFIDDSLTNVRAAETAGLKTLQFESNEQLIQKLNDLLKLNMSR